MDFGQLSGDDRAVDRVADLAGVHGTRGNVLFQPETNQVTERCRVEACLNYQFALPSFRKHPVQFWTQSSLAEHGEHDHVVNHVGEEVPVDILVALSVKTEENGSWFMATRSFGGRERAVKDVVGEAAATIGSNMRLVSIFVSDVLLTQSNLILLMKNSSSLILLQVPWRYSLHTLKAMDR